MRNSESVHGAGAPSPPSEEGGVTAYKGLKRRDGRRDTPSVCESGKYRRAQNKICICIIQCTLHLSVSSNRAFSLPQSFVAAKQRQNPAPSSEGAEAATAARHRFTSVHNSAFRIPHYLINGSPRFFSVAGEICDIYTFSLFPSEVMQKLFGSS